MWSTVLARLYVSFCKVIFLESGSRLSLRTLNINMKLVTSRPHSGPAVDSDSNRNLPGGKELVRLTGASTSHNPVDLHGLLQG
jgi:hypothetical protein